MLYAADEFSRNHGDSYVSTEHLLIGLAKVQSKAQTLLRQAATEAIMAHCPTPILIVSSSTNRGEMLRTYEARESADRGLDARALAAEIHRPEPHYLDSFEEAAETLRKIPRFVRRFAVEDSRLAHQQMGCIVDIR
mgnify:CR=1 FL=1